jgi:carboxylesterase
MEGMSYPGGIPADSAVINGAQPIHLAGDSRLPAILLLHGYTGYAGDMRFLATRLNEAGYSVVVPRYPGHGTNSRDFRWTTWRDWLRRATDAYLELAGHHERIIVGGLSMGGVISSIIAARFPVERLFLLAPALQVTNRLVPFTPILRFLVPPRPVAEPESYDDPERQYMADQYWNTQWPAQTASLYRLMRIGRRGLPAIHQPVLTVVSEADRTVPAAVAELLSARLSSTDHTIVRLQESGHVVTNDTERERVADEVVAWLKRD